MSRRLSHILVSIVLGIAGALGLALLIPDAPPRWRSCLGPGPDFARPYLVAALACGLALGIYGVLRALPRRSRRPRLPKAILLR